jgi:hypothetical protein
LLFYNKKLFIANLFQKIKITSLSFTISISRC